ncbi:MAG TPA: DMT family transporter [Gemmataceae bacterium]|nr:DMT family transporter [Gemmataceae bacterium]
MPAEPAAPFPPAHGRLCVALAALLWSTSGAFTKVLTLPTPLGLHEPTITALQIACGRSLFGALVLLPALRRRDLSFRPLMAVMVLSFVLMNATFVSAQALGTAANAIVLQYTGPLWMYLASVWLLGERADRRNLTALGIGLAGVAVIVGGGWQAGELATVGVGLASGVGYAGVLICLRVLSGASSRWLTVLNLLAGGLMLVPFVWSLALPAPGQLAVLFVYGAAQMALPYWLVARGLRGVSPQEAGIITLLELPLNPVWAYLVSGERPRWFTFAGGAFILGALAWRYAPRPRPRRPGPGRDAPGRASAT